MPASSAGAEERAGIHRGSSSPARCSLCWAAPFLLPGWSGRGMHISALTSGGLAAHTGRIRRGSLFFALFLLGNFGDFAALAFAPQSVITPLGASSLVVTPLLARCFLHEEWTFATICGSAIVILGVLTIVTPSILLASCSSETIDSLVDRWRQPGFIVWATAQLSCVALTLVGTGILERRMRRAPSAAHAPAPGVAPPTNGGAGAAADSRAEGVVVGTPDCSNSSTRTSTPDKEEVDKEEEAADAACTSEQPRPKRDNDGSTQRAVAHGTVSARLSQLQPRERKLLRLGYCVLSGALASWTVLFSKCFGELVKNSVVSGVNPWVDGRFYSLCVWLLLTIPLQLKYLNRALMSFEATFVVPTMQATWSLCSITTGALFFREFGAYEAPHIGAFFVGVVMTLLGVYVLSSQPVKTRQQRVNIVRPGAHVHSHLSRREATRRSRRVLFSGVVGGGGRRVRPASPGMEADDQAPHVCEPVCA